MASLREKKEEPIDKLEIVVYRLFLRELSSALYLLLRLQNIVKTKRRKLFSSKLSTR